MIIGGKDLSNSRKKREMEIIFLKSWKSYKKTSVCLTIRTLSRENRLNTWET